MILGFWALGIVRISVHWLAPPQTKTNDLLKGDTMSEEDMFAKQIETFKTFCKNELAAKAKEIEEEKEEIEQSEYKHGSG